ncbi:MAG: CoA transferase [Actinomycetota bacterium]|nr:CoA transferase [Actinomycetota bacterium]
MLSTVGRRAVAQWTPRVQSPYRLGSGQLLMAKCWPAIIDARVASYGTDGACRDNKAYALLNESGLLSISGASDAIAKIPVAIADIAAGAQLATGVLAALIVRPPRVERYRSKSRSPCWSGWASLCTSRWGSDMSPRRAGEHPQSPHTARKPAVGGLVTDNRVWRPLCTNALRHLEFAEERLWANVRRVERRSELDQILNGYAPPNPRLLVRFGPAHMVSQLWVGRHIAQPVDPGVAAARRTGALEVLRTSGDTVITFVRSLLVCRGGYLPSFVWPVTSKLNTVSDRRGQ